MNATMTALKEQAIANRRNGYYMATASAETGAGTVLCIVDFSHGNKKHAGTHVAARFELNGRRVSAKKLTAALS